MDFQLQKNDPILIFFKKKNLTFNLLKKSEVIIKAVILKRMSLLSLLYQLSKFI